MDSASQIERPTVGDAAETRPDKAALAKTTLWVRTTAWCRSLLGKITLVFLGGVMFAYGIGAFVGWSMFVDATTEQWRNQARINTQIASATLRSVYTYISISADDSGQVNRIVTSQPIGDDDSILYTGFNPVDVLALVTAQTKNDTWLFNYDAPSGMFNIVAASEDKVLPDDTGLPFNDAPLFKTDGRQGRFATGFATVNGRRHYLGLLPIVGPEGEVLGAVATSIGKASDLYLSQEALVRNSLVVLLVILTLTSFAVTVMVKRLFRPVPALVQATLRIANEMTDTVTPFQDRADELGDMAVAIETLREAVVERGRLREIRDMAVQMEHMAHHDVLTGLPNRALLMKSLNEAIDTNASAGFNVMLLDLDHFKAVNDTLGHACGDALLTKTAERITAVLGLGDIAARLGGDEFAVIQRVSRNAEHEATKLASRILEAISSGFILEGHDVIVGTSIGIACAPAHGTTAGQLLQSADLALYRAKAAGRGTFVFFEEGMDMIAQGQHALQIDLRLALKRGEFEVHYQPIIRLRDETICGFEALVRWRHPQLGLVPPDSFIPLAEEIGIIVPLGEWVLQRACVDAAAWPDDIRLAVNLSAVQLRNPGIVETVASALEISGLAASRLELEVTETVMLVGEASISALDTLREMGTGIVLDDFGTGYASLSYLEKIRFSKVKIDKDFVANLSSSPASRAIIGAVTGLARQLDMEVTAEGVETEEQLIILKASGCGNAQGYHFARPLPLAELRYELVSRVREDLKLSSSATQPQAPGRVRKGGA